MGHCRHAVQQTALGLVLGSVRRSLASIGDRWWISASPVQLGRLSVSYPGSGGAFQKGCCQVRDRQAGQLGTHSLRHSYRSWPDAVGTECPAAEVDAAPRHPPTMNIYGDVVTDEMERAHLKIVALALNRSSMSH